MTKDKITTVTVGIPAFNEAGNIGYLLKAVAGQKETNFKVVKIMVASDGSTDDTNKIVAAFKDKRIALQANKVRRGKASMQNQIINTASSDILVLLDADIRITDKDFIDKLIQPIVLGQAELTSCPLIALPPSNYLERVLSYGGLFKDAIFEKYRDADNLYTCHGPARALGRKLYKSIQFKHSVSEDAYTYLFCTYWGMKYSYVKSTKIFFKLPSTYADHEKQNFRAFEMREQFEREFGKVFVVKQYHLPLWLKLQELMPNLVTRPIDLVAYVGLYFFLRIKALFKAETKSAWQMASSSKILKGAI